jgi:hypothetical protein
VFFKKAYKALLTRTGVRDPQREHGDHREDDQEGQQEQQLVPWLNYATEGYFC